MSRNSKTALNVFRTMAVLFIALPQAAVAQRTIQIPGKISAGGERFVWPRAEPAEVGLDKEKLEAAAQIAEGANSFSFLVVRQGKLAFERYFQGKTAEDVQQNYSAAKSPFSFLIGRAIEQGHFKGLDQSLGDFIDEMKVDGKDKVTIRGILAMESGLAQSRELDEADAASGDSQLEVGLRRKMTHEPLTHYAYNNAGYRLLFTALEKATGMSLEDYTERELFEPLDMKGAYWMLLQREGRHLGYQSIRMRPIDMAKVGQIALDGGLWRGKRYLRADYVRQLLTPASAEANPSYGLFWHLNGDYFRSYFVPSRIERRLLPGVPSDAFTQHGSGTQFITGIPSLGLVVVRTGREPDSSLSFYSPTESLNSVLVRKVVEAIQD